MKQIDYDFLEKLSLPGKMQANPAKEAVAFVRSKLDYESNTYKSNLWLYDGERFISLTADDKVRDFVWEGNDFILFSAERSDEEKKRTKDGMTYTNYYRLPLRGGEARPAFTLPFSVSSLEPLGNNYYLVEAEFNVELPNAYVLDEEQQKKLAKDKKEQSFYTKLTEIPFYFNGREYFEGDRTGLFLYNSRMNQIERISRENLDVDFYRLSEDKRRLYFAGYEWNHRVSLYSGLHYVELPLDDEKSLSEIPVLRCVELYPDEDFSFSDAWEIDPDRKGESRVFVLASNLREYGLNESHKIYEVDKAEGVLIAINTESFEGYSSINTDVDYGAGPGSFVRKGAYYFVATDRDRDVLYRINKEGIVEPLYVANGAILAVQQFRDSFITIGLEDMFPPELFIVREEENGFESTLISKFNRNLFTTYDLIRPVRVESGEDIDIDGWILYPANFEPNLKYPAILDVHGGPRTAYAPVFFHEMQVWAQRGYFVLFANPRGSAGRGDAFADIRGKYGSIDYDDLMNFVDACLEAIPAIDKGRLGVTGGSYGGFMSNWIIGHTDRFKACATQRSISNWISFYGTSDIGFNFACDQNATKTRDQAGFMKLWEYSPLRYINSCKTPTLILHSAKDYRCPLEQGYQLFTALKDREIDSELIVFHEETHELSRSGKPKARRVRLEAITDWMNKYLVENELEEEHETMSPLELGGESEDGIREVYDGENFVYNEEFTTEIEERKEE